MKTGCDTRDVLVNMNTRRRLTQDFKHLLKPWGQGTFHCLVPTPPFPLLIWMSPLLILPPPSLMHPGCTVYNQKEQTEGFSLLVEYAELGMFWNRF